ncbi:hypothetical protein BKA66DRAFT_611279 [Pyrenochaeta sp. MPI-SDFR-AT-0127]|nr:hypothetical protein BKA66DRAFT_611279 [Pyrenochaeta sp. MPI-SDFR-AT-0127]
MSVKSVQKEFKYKFANPEYLNLALKAAHRSDLDGIADDGNRGLSQMGLSVLEMVETYHTVFVEKGTQKLATTRKSWIRSKSERAKTCRKLGIHQHIVRSVRQQHEEPSPTVLANTLSAIFGAMWIDMQEKNQSGSDIVKQISVVLRYIESVVASEPTFGHMTSENEGFPALEENGGIPESLTPGRWGLLVPSEACHNTSSFLDLPVSFPWSTEVFQGPKEAQNEALRAVEPTSFYFGNMIPTIDLALLEQAQEASTIASNSASALSLTNRENIETSIAPASQIESDITLSNNKSSSRVTKSSRMTVTPAKRKSSQGLKKGIEDDILLKRLIPEEMAKICNLQNQCSGKHLMALLDHAQLTSLSNDISWVIQLRLFYFAIGSCQSLLSFKEILENVRKISGLTSATFIHCRTSSESYQMIRQLSNTEALCVLLKRCHTVKLFETESACITQSTVTMNVETPSNFGARRGSEAGNPANKCKATITDAMMRKIVPELEKGTKELLSIPETIFRQFLDIVDEYQGPILRELSIVVGPVLEMLVQGDLQGRNPFPIECVEARDIEQFPKGSREILECLSGSPLPG